MNICELIDACGGPNVVRIQSLDHCADKLDWSHKTGSRITFGSEQAITPEGTKDLGIIVWLDRGAVDAALTAARATLSTSGATNDGDEQ